MTHENSSLPCFCFLILLCFSLVDFLQIVCTRLCLDWFLMSLSVFCIAVDIVVVQNQLEGKKKDLFGLQVTVHDYEKPGQELKGRIQEAGTEVGTLLNIRFPGS